ncbi:nuclear fragile X mental retardation-interacting protein 1-domain-containing protein [Russula compacta]|nr:nuclear fragile X mental retardation-interacting protein 1-domain-containing protein [Russula compacta]
MDSSAHDDDDDGHDTNPYAELNHTPHYAAAYAPRPHVNPQGYAYSSTYNPLTHSSSHPSTSWYSPTPSFRNSSSASGSRNSFPRGAPPTHWYASGNSKCTHSGCTFTGSVSSVQTHMMDRHLIYPPGWNFRKRQPDWDADPSLKGKLIPILGTNVRLDTPEDIAAWIAERKRRWPTAARVAEKKRKLEEAMANGELHPNHLALMGKKRPRPAPLDAEATRQERGRGGGFGGRGRGRRAGGRNRSYGGRPRGGGGGGITSAPTQPSPRSTVNAESRLSVSLPEREVASHLGSDADSGSNGDAPEVVSAKRPPGIEAYESSSDAESEQPPAVNDRPQPRLTNPSSPGGGPAAVSTLAKSESVNHLRRAPPPQPKNPPRNPFAARSSLLRNLLLPEIRMTVSNLSQAIRFLVDNDFLENVELKPGEANERRIEVLGEGPTSEDTELHSPIG